MGEFSTQIPAGHNAVAITIPITIPYPEKKPNCTLGGAIGAVVIGEGMRARIIPYAEKIGAGFLSWSASRNVGFLHRKTTSVRSGK